MLICCLKLIFFCGVETPLEAIQYAHKLHEVQTFVLDREIIKTKEFSLNSNQTSVKKNHIDFLEDFIKFYGNSNKNDTEYSALDRLKMILRHVSLRQGIRY